MRLYGKNKYSLVFLAIIFFALSCLMLSSCMTKIQYRMNKDIKALFIGTWDLKTIIIEYGGDEEEINADDISYTFNEDFTGFVINKENKKPFIWYGDSKDNNLVLEFESNYIERYYSIIFEDIFNKKTKSPTKFLNL